MPPLPLRLDFGAIEPGNCGPACLVLQMYDKDQDVLLMTGVQNDRFVKLEVPPGLRVSLLGLSHDGTRIALRADYLGLPYSDLRIVDLTTSTETCFQEYGTGVMAAFASDGTLESSRLGCFAGLAMLT